MRRRRNSVAVTGTSHSFTNTWRLSGSTATRLAQHGGRRRLATAKDRAHAPDELARAERLGHIIVGADIEAARSSSVVRAVSMMIGT